jgi:hypothetical protein
MATLRYVTKSGAHVVRTHLKYDDAVRMGLFVQREQGAHDIQVSDTDSEHVSLIAGAL